MNADERQAVLVYVRDLAAHEKVRVTAHAHQEIVEEEISLDDVFSVIATAMCWRTTLSTAVARAV